jgi:antitoxin (DNA-binding transcriptional repressor) of toxin-antitoxin stability system
MTVTVDGRPVAELGPIGRERRAGDVQSLDRIFALGPVDPYWSGDLDQMRDEDHEAARER